MEEEVAGNPIDTHSTCKTDGLLLGIAHLAVVDADVAQNVALTVAHCAIGVDIADAVALGVKNLQLLDGAHCLASDIAHRAVGVKRADRVHLIVPDHAVTVDATDAVEVGIAQHLCVNARCHEPGNRQHNSSHV